MSDEQKYNSRRDNNRSAQAYLNWREGTSVILATHFLRMLFRYRSGNNTAPMAAIESNSLSVTISSGSAREIPPVNAYPAPAPPSMALKNVVMSNSIFNLPDNERQITQVLKHLQIKTEFVIVIFS